MCQGPETLEMKFPNLFSQPVLLAIYSKRGSRLPLIERLAELQFAVGQSGAAVEPIWDTKPPSAFYFWAAKPDC